MNIDHGLGLGRVQRGIVHMALTSGSFYLNDMLGEGYTDSQYKSLHRAAQSLTVPGLRLIVYQRGVCYPKSTDGNTTD